jgi:hypothetical protein
LVRRSGRLPKWLLSTPSSVWPGFLRRTEPTFRRSFPLPSELQKGESGGIGGRALYACRTLLNSSAAADKMRDRS